jgi:DNA-binding MarR family transcriptional regulator
MDSSSTKSLPAISASNLARELGTSVPRVVRAAQRLGFDNRSGSGRLSLAPEQAQKLRSVLGRHQSAPGLTDTETMVLAAVARSPLGLTSARAVARKAGLSPTVASRALARLSERDLITNEQATVAAGRVRRVQLLHANRHHPSYRALAPLLARVVPPQFGRDEEVPARLRHLFWNTSPTQLNVAHGGEYIARRLLRTLDPSGLAWGARNLGAADWRAAARARGLAPSVKALAENLAAGQEDS